LDLIFLICNLIIVKVFRQTLSKLSSSAYQYNECRGEGPRSCCQCVSIPTLLVQPFDSSFFVARLCFDFVLLGSSWKNSKYDM
jgi:hypothetical protein